MAEVQTEVELPYADRLGPLCVNGTKAVGSAGDDDRRGIEPIGEASRGGGQGKVGELVSDLVAHMLEGVEFLGIYAAEVGLVARERRGRRGQRDPLPEEVGQKIAKVE